MSPYGPNWAELVGQKVCECGTCLKPARSVSVPVSAPTGVRLLCPHLPPAPGVPRSLTHASLQV